MSKAGSFAALLALAACASCSGGFDRGVITGPSTFFVAVTQVNGQPLPASDKPLAANYGDRTEAWTFTIEARTPEGKLDPSFNGVVRLSSRPGAITEITADGAVGRNLKLTGGKASGTVALTAVYGPSRLWVDDLGYVPFVPAAGKKPQCSNGKDDNGNTLIDFPAEPGCAFADDDTEEGGSYASGVSAPVAYALPTLGDLQGYAPLSPYPYESIQVNADAPQRLVVTRVASDGFYVTDVSADAVKKGYNHIFAFNFSTPSGMRVCDRVTYLSGTVNDFFGFTELSFPSYKLSFPIAGQDACEVPDATVLDHATLNSPPAMENIESSLVRIEGFHVSKSFGPNNPTNGVFGPDASSCDFNGDGQVDFTANDEGTCANNCSADPECSEWTEYSARGSYKVSYVNPTTKVTDMILVNTGTVSGFDPTANKGRALDALTGTLRDFSGGTLNWTIETRCSDDLACQFDGCVKTPIPSQQACVRLRTVDDNDEGSN
jgi:hypothetical protein